MSDFIWNIGGKALLFFFLPMLGAIVGNLLPFWGATLSYYNRDRDLDLRMAQFAIDILSQSAEQSDPGYEVQRRFAIKALVKFSGLEISPEEENRWATFAGFPMRRSWDAFCVDNAAEFLIDPTPDRFRDRWLVGCNRTIDFEVFQNSYKLLQQSTENTRGR